VTSQHILETVVTFSLLCCYVVLSQNTHASVAFLTVLLLYLNSLVLVGSFFILVKKKNNVPGIS